MRQLYPLLIACWMVAVFGCNTKPPKKSYFFLNSVTAMRETLPRISKKHIEKLQIARIDLANEDLVIIATFENLDYLLFDGCEIDDDDLKYVAKLERLRILDLSSPDISDAGLAHLAKLKNLEALKLSANGITDAGLIHVAGLQNLEKLTLRCEHVTGSGFQFLAGKLPLRHLDCEGPMDDEAMKHVERFEGLQDLWLSGTQVTDAGLMRVSRNYWLINVSASKTMTEEGLLAFRKALLEGRRQARESGVVVPPDDALQISCRFANPEVRGALLDDEYCQRLDALWASREKH